VLYVLLPKLFFFVSAFPTVTDGQSFFPPPASKGFPEVPGSPPGEVGRRYLRLPPDLGALPDTYPDGRTFSA